MPKNPLTIVLAALILAIGVNVYYFATGSELTTVVSRTLFADLLLVLTMVPVYESVRLRLTPDPEPIPARIKAAMKSVLIYTLFMGLTTFILFKLFGDPLIGDRISQLREMLDAAPDVTEELKEQRLATAKSIYAPSTHTLAMVVGTLFTGMLSSVLAAFVVKK